MRGFEDLDVGDRTQVRLRSTDVQRSFIDFEKTVLETRGRPTLSTGR